MIWNADIQDQSIEVTSPGVEWLSAGLGKYWWMIYWYGHPCGNIIPSAVYSLDSRGAFIQLLLLHYTCHLHCLPHPWIIDIGNRIRCLFLNGVAAFYHTDVRLYPAILTFTWARIAGGILMKTSFHHGISCLAAYQESKKVVSVLMIFRGFSRDHFCLHSTFECKT